MNGKLTIRELEIAKFVTDGVPARKISENLKISYFTVKNYKKVIFSKMDVNNSVQLTSKMFRAGLIK